ncbi:MAG: condensation domain-containing protein [Acidimicrobiales bacterium]
MSTAAATSSELSPLREVPPLDGVDDLLPLTPAQTGMLFETLSQSDPEVYFEQVRFDLVGPLDLDRFRAAWQLVHEQHSMLRTVFLWDGLDEPLQAVLSEVELDWNVVGVAGDDDAAAVSDGAGSPREWADQLAAQRRSTGIDLGVGPISSFDLLPIDDQRMHVIWSFHHLLLDGWSTARVVGEVLDRYEGVDADHISGASEFRPYLEWLADRDAGATEAYWRTLLASVDEPTTIAPGGASPGGQFVRGRIDAQLSAPESALVRAFARSQRVTVNTMVQAAWARTLARYTGRRDVVFGVTVSGRPPDLDGAAEAVGMFLNTLPFPVSVNEGDDVDGDWLGSLQRQQLDVSHHGHASLAEVQRFAPADGALFDSILVFENYPMRVAHEAPSVEVEHYTVFEQTHYALTVMAGDVPDAASDATSDDSDGRPLGFIVVYDESRLAPWFARQMVDDLTDELVRLASPADPLDDLANEPARSASPADPLDDLANEPARSASPADPLDDLANEPARSTSPADPVDDLANEPARLDIASGPSRRPRQRTGALDIASGPSRFLRLAQVCLTLGRVMRSPSVTPRKQL